MDFYSSGHPQRTLPAVENPVQSKSHLHQNSTCVPAKKPKVRDEGKSIIGGIASRLAGHTDPHEDRDENGKLRASGKRKAPPFRCVASYLGPGKR